MPSIRLYGGVHNDPGSRRKFLEELAKQETPPHFVAVEWDKSVFERLVEWRPWIERELGSLWTFLKREDRRELSRALAWEGDAHTEQFPTVDRLWLEAGFQQADLRRRYGADADDVPKSLARSLLDRLSPPCSRTMPEWMGNADPPPEPKSKKELIDRVSSKMWSELSQEGERLPPGAEDFERDKRWAAAISQRSSGLGGGWIAIVVGWAHADPEGDSRRLYGLLSSNGFAVNAVCLAPLVS